MTLLSTFFKTYIVGIVGAGLSTTFALYMLVNGQTNEVLPDITIAHAPVVSPLEGHLITASIPKRADSDNKTSPTEVRRQTGPIRKEFISSTYKAAKQDKLKIARLPPKDPQSMYILRLATKEMALLEGYGKLWNVQPGHILPGSGRVLQIKKNGAKWVVITTNGEISE